MMMVQDWGRGALFTVLLFCGRIRGAKLSQLVDASQPHPAARSKRGCANRTHTVHPTSFIAVACQARLVTKSFLHVRYRSTFLDSGVVSISYEDQGRSLMIHVHLERLAHGPEEVRI